MTILPRSTSIKGVTAKAKNITVKWAKQAAATSGYQVQYSTSKSFKSKKSATVKGAKSCVKVIKGLKSGKKYYVRVRSYKTVNGKKVYSKWSTTAKTVR